MAALALYAFNAVHLLYDVTQVFIASGFSLSRSYNYLQIKRRRYLFRVYCLQVWRRYLITTQAAALEKALNTNLNSVALGTSGASEEIREVNETRISYNQNQVKSRKPKTNTEAIDITESAKMLKPDSGIDFAAVEASAEAYDNQLRHHHAESRIEQDLHEVVMHFNDIEVINGAEFDSTFYEYVETRPVYRSKDISPLKEGVSLAVTGYIQLNCERFSINLILNNERHDVALHINPRLPHNYIVRNTKVKDVWGGEEVSSPLPFSLRRGSKFAIQILVTDACYMISVNGHHFAEYNHRLPYKSVDSIEVKGDVEHVNVERAMVTSYPERLPESQAKDIALVDDDSDEARNELSIPPDFKIIPRQGKLIPDQDQASLGLPLPYYGRMPPKALTVGNCLRIEGRVKVLPHSFYINLQRGQQIWPHAVIAFHFNPRFSKQGGCVGKHVVCRNAWFNGKWADEERSELDTDFRPGKTFSLLIVPGAKAYEVYVNSKLITEFVYRVEPDIVDTIYIQGDIKLWNVVLMKKSKEVRVYENPAYIDEGV